MNKKTALCLFWMALASTVFAWDYQWHRLVSQLALETLPQDFPAFVKTPEARERILFLSGEADRWRNSNENTFKHLNNPDHYLDLEDIPLAGLDPLAVSPFRYEFVAQFAAARAKNIDRFPPIDPARNSDKTRELPGFLPWTLNEHFGRLKSQFSYLREYTANGNADEIRNAEQNIIYVMGLMSHFAADATQPLHLTRHYNGWVGPNPRGYTTNKQFHQWIDGDYLEKVGLDASSLMAKLRPARAWRTTEHQPAEGLFPEIMKFCIAQNQLVEKLYQMEKDGQLAGEGEKGRQGREFLADQIVKAAQLLGDLWLMAWKEAPGDSFLRRQLLKRNTKTNR
jgi:hypothetical protein